MTPTCYCCYGCVLPRGCPFRDFSSFLRFRDMSEALGSKISVDVAKKTDRAVQDGLFILVSRSMR